ncbi:hypothetical protein CVS40_9235 [Lucilia cuprina]|nr:hypothetical protein CVS40_9235 [Lucilia cuprina]
MFKHFPVLNGFSVDDMAEQKLIFIPYMFQELIFQLGLLYLCSFKSYRILLFEFGKGCGLTPPHDSRPFPGYAHEQGSQDCWAADIVPPQKGTLFGSDWLFLTMNMGSFQ